MMNKVPLSDLNINFEKLRYRWDSLSLNELDEEYDKLVHKIHLLKNIGSESIANHLMYILKALDLYIDDRN